MNILSIFLFFVTFLAVSNAVVNYQDHKVVKFRIENEKQLLKAQELEIMAGVSLKMIQIIFKLIFSLSLNFGIHQFK